MDYDNAGGSMPESIEFVDFAAHKLQLSPCATRQERIAHSRQMLLRSLGLGTTVAVIGSGMTVPFGYPSWQELAIEILELTLELIQGDKEVSEVSDLLSGARTKGNLNQTALMFLIGVCKRTLQDKGRMEDYYAKFRQIFRQGTSLRKNSFDVFLDLPISRFVTTNYDCEIERALMKKRGLSAKDFGLECGSKGRDPIYPSSPRSFTQRAESLHHLAHFALSGFSDNADRVFHCHGRFDDPETIVATEDDYQHWYLGKQEGATLAFQQSFELLLGSNPLLFIGYGLRDEDLLRPLRELVALDPKRKGSRPIFALLEEEDGSSDSLHNDGLFDRFGLHVIPFSSRGKEMDQRTDALCQTLRDLRTDCDKATHSRSCKPRLRPPFSGPALPAPHLDIRPESPVKPKLWQQTVQADLLAPGVTVLVGPSGSAKTDRALELLGLAASHGPGVRKFDGKFYWNAHYANETVTGIDYALGYLDPKGRGPHHDRILRCLRDHPHLLVIDGCERLLRKGEKPSAGDAYSINFRRLLRAFADPHSQSTVILAGRDWPSDLDPYLNLGPPSGRPTVRRIDVARMTSEEISPPSPFSYSPDDRDFSALFSLLEGHHYGLDLASRYLRNSPRKRLTHLNQELAKRRRDERLCEMFQIVLNSLDQDGCKGLASAFLGRLCLFLNPICEAALSFCYGQAWEEQNRKKALPAPEISPDERDAAARRLSRQMMAGGLLLPAGFLSAGKSHSEGYTVHATARRLLFQSHRSLDYDPLPAVGLSGFTAGRTGVPPDRDHWEEIKSLFEQILQQADAEACPLLCRDAFGLLRTRMEANTVSRWTTYDEYLPFGIQVARLAKKLSGDRCWTYCEPLNARYHTEDPDAPLYAAELAWLYNDLALALSAEGSIADACTLWEQALEVSRLLESPEGGSFHLELLISLTLTSIEMGRLPAARGYLEEADRILLTDSDDDAQARILGLRGLMAHLGGDLQAADDLYERCLHLLRSGTNLRAQSLFLKHRADIKLTTGQLEQADLLIRNSRALAEAGIFPELIANARLSEGHRLFRSGDPVRARLEYTAVLKEAQGIGVRKLETRALTALARLALDQKDADSAHRFALHSLRLANEMGLGIRQTHSLVVLGLTTLAIDERDLGIAFLRQAKKLADSQEYWARSREAENKLQELNVDPNGTEYPAKTIMRGRE
jgi:tetratricopeptide (TPR) repeat protein